MTIKYQRPMNGCPEWSEPNEREMEDGGRMVRKDV